MSKGTDPFTELNRMFDRLAEGLGEGGLAEPTAVPVDVAETDDEVVVTADLPGYDPDDIDVAVDGRTLTIGATRETAEQDEGDEGRYLRRERRRQRTSRSVTLPADVAEREATADYDAGVLTVTLPKTHGGGHRIEIE